MFRRLRRRSCLICALAFHATVAGAATLPYTDRTHGYSGWSTTIRGDIRTIGTAGATVGLADTFIASVDNPAGLAMTLGGFGVQLAGNTIYDQHIQDYTQPVQATNLGAAGATYPWGFSLGFWAPQNEQASYTLRDGTPVTPEIYVRETRASVARLFFDNRLSLGLGLILGRASKNILDDSNTSYAFSGNFGAMVQLPHRWLLGVSYSLPLLYSADPISNPSPGITNFYRPVKTPWRLSVGPGWIPNRFFRTGFTFALFGPTTDTALLSDTDRLVGENTVIQPRVGAYYEAVEYKELIVEAYAGSYYEVSRVADTGSRPHITGGLEVNFWIFSLGWGIDAASGYKNYIYSAGLNVLKIMRKLDLIPPEWHAPYGGILPSPFRFSDAGLPRPLVSNWRPRGEEDLIETSKRLPERLQKKAINIGESVIDVIGAVTGTTTQQPKPPAPNKKKPIRNKKRKKPAPPP